MIANLTQNELVTFQANFIGEAPTIFPTVSVEKQGAAILAQTIMVERNSRSFTYDYTTGVSATIGNYEVIYRAITGPLLVDVSDLASDGAGTGISSATGGFTADMVDTMGIWIPATGGFTAGFFPIIGFTDTNNITIGSSAGANKSGGVGQVGNMETLTEEYRLSVNDSDDIKAETASIQADTDSIETKLDTVDTNLDTLKDVDLPAHDAKLDIVDGNVDEIETLLNTVDGKVDVIDTNVDAILATIELGEGDKSVIFHVKDSVPNDVIGVKVTVHNAANDEAPIAGPAITDINGDTPTFNLNVAPDYTIRFSKAGAVNETQTKAVTGDETIECVVTVAVPSSPGAPNLCRIRIYATDISGVDLGSLDIEASTNEKLTLIDGIYYTNTEGPFTYDATTSPDSAYFDAVQGSTLKIQSDILGINGRTMVVPATANADLSDYIPIVV